MRDWRRAQRSSLGRYCTPPFRTPGLAKSLSVSFNSREHSRWIAAIFPAFANHIYQSRRIRAMSANSRSLDQLHKQLVGPIKCFTILRWKPRRRDFTRVKLVELSTFPAQTILLFQIQISQGRNQLEDMQRTQSCRPEPPICTQVVYVMLID